MTRRSLRGKRLRPPGNREASRGKGRRRWLPLQVRRWLPPMVIAVVVAGLVTVIAFATYQAATSEDAGQARGVAEETDDSPDLPGQFIPTQGRAHLAPGLVYPVCSADVVDDCYASNPPTSGPHSSTSVEWGIYSEPQPREKLIHNMEHGGVIVWYNCDDCEEVIADLTDILADYHSSDPHRLMTPYPDMEEDTIAITSWTRIDKFRVEDYTPERVKRFIDAHEGRFNPEGA